MAHQKPTRSIDVSRIQVLNQKPGRQEIRQAQVYQKAIDIMFEKAPGFAPAWQITLKEAEEHVQQAERGLIPFLKRMTGTPGKAHEEDFETDYFPVMNLSRPSVDEHACYVLGSLCTPHDVWGYAYHGSDIRPGDALLVPTQGAYTYSLRQQFIKPLPRTVLLDGTLSQGTV